MESFGWLFKTREVLSELFWWDTWNGLQFSRVTLYRYINFPIKWYYLKHEPYYKNPKEHPNYKKFLITIKDLKK